MIRKLSWVVIQSRRREVPLKGGGARVIRITKTRDAIDKQRKLIV